MNKFLFLPPPRSKSRAGSLDLLSAEITRIAAKSDGKLTFGFLLGLGIALWSSNAGMKAIFDALNIIYDEDEKRGLIWLNIVSLFFTVCAIAAVGVAISLVVVFPLFLAAFGLTSLDHPIVGYLRWPVMFVLMILGLSVLYRYGPSRRLAKWRWISIGSVFAALAWLAESSLFSWYLGNFANYNATYGALGAVVGLMSGCGFRYRGAGRCRTQLRDRVTDRTRFHRRVGQAARSPRPGHGRHRRCERPIGITSVTRPTQELLGWALRSCRCEAERFCPF
jgi:hypothetical protein